MPYTVPTASDLKARFPAFEAVNDEIVASALGEAASMVDDRWVNQTDFSMGRILYAAHVLTMDGFGTGAEAEAARAGTMGFTTIKSADLTLTREGRGSGGAGSDLAATQYGRRFLDILRRNVPAVAIV